MHADDIQCSKQLARSNLITRGKLALTTPELFGLIHKAHCAGKRSVTLFGVLIIGVQNPQKAHLNERVWSCV